MKVVERQAMLNKTSLPLSTQQDSVTYMDVMLDSFSREK